MSAVGEEQARYPPSHPPQRDALVPLHRDELEIPPERRRLRIERLLNASDLPREKTLATLKRSKLPPNVAKTLPTLCDGGFVERGDNVLALGLSVRGKTHLVCALGHELVQRGHRVLFTPTFALFQRLLAAKRDLRLEKELAILDRFDAVIFDDIGYVQQSRGEMEVLSAKPKKVRRCPPPIHPDRKPNELDMKRADAMLRRRGIVTWAR